MKTQVTTYHLEMLDPAQLRPAREGEAQLQLQRAEIPCPQLNRFLYASVGGDWYWIDRLGWSYDKWFSYLNRPQLETWVAYVSGTPAGYYELEMQPEESVELVYFGLLPQFMGQGLGGAMLATAVKRAWAMGAVRVWVHTCSLDGPHALANYQARGFHIFKEETEDVALPDHPPGPWPGARNVQA